MSEEAKIYSEDYDYKTYWADLFASQDDVFEQMKSLSARLKEVSKKVSASEREFIGEFGFLAGFYLGLLERNCQDEHYKISGHWNSQQYLEKISVWIGREFDKEQAVGEHTIKHRVDKAKSSAFTEVVASGAFDLIPYIATGNSDHIPEVITYENGLEIKKYYTRGKLTEEYYHGEFSRLFGESAKEGMNLYKRMIESDSEHKILELDGYRIVWIESIIAEFPRDAERVYTEEEIRGVVSGSLRSGRERRT